MKTESLQLVATVACVVLVGCASRPTARPLLVPAPTSISVAADKRIVSDVVGHPTAVLAAGDYRRVAEDKIGYYYANAETRVTIDGKSVKGGIGYEKSLGRFFVYRAFGEKEAKNAAREIYGDAVASLAKSSTSDGVSRLFLFWILGDAPDHWKVDAPPRANQPPQRNAGSRPSSGDSPASETSSSHGPRG